MEESYDSRYKSLALLISQSQEDHKNQIKQLEKIFGEKLNHIGEEIRDMKDEIKEHNSRLRKVEIEHIRVDERTKITNTTIGEIWKELKSTKSEMDECKINVEQLNRVNRWIKYMQDKPFQVIFTATAVVGGIAALSAYIRVLIESIIQ